MAQTRTGEAFGPAFALPDDQSGETPNDWSDEALFGNGQAQAPAEPASATPPQQPEAPSQPGVAPTQPEEPAAAGEQTPEAQPGEQQPEPKKWAGRYQSPEELEKGYKNIQRLNSKTVEQLQRAELERQQLLAQLEQVRPYLQQLQQLSSQPPPVLPPDVDLTELPPEQLQALIDAQVEAHVDQRVQEQTQRLLQAQQQMQEQALRGQEAQVAQSWMAANGVAPDDELDLAIGDIVEEFRDDGQGGSDPNLFPITQENLDLALELARNDGLREMFFDLDLVPKKEHLEIAKEAVQNSSLGEVLLANPALVDTDHGLQWARKQAQLPGMYQRAAQGAQPPTPDQQRKAAHVETGGTGAPVQTPPGTAPKDEFDEVIDSFNSGRSTNVFGLPVS